MFRPFRAWVVGSSIPGASPQELIGLLTPKHFYMEKGRGCRLSKEGRGIFFPAWYNDAEPWLRVPIRNALALMLDNLRQYRHLYR